MYKYYVTKRTNQEGRREIHREGCAYLPERGSCLYLGKLASSFSAVAEARRIYTDINGCFHCAPECHLN